MRLIPQANNHQLRRDVSLTLPAGAYRIKFEAANLASVARDVSVSAEVRHAELNITLAVAQVRSRVTVTAEAGYAAVETESGTKTETSLLEVPQSISVVTRQLLDDQGAVRLDDALGERRRGRARRLLRQLGLLPHSRV